MKAPFFVGKKPFKMDFAKDISQWILNLVIESVFPDVSRKRSLDDDLFADTLTTHEDINALHEQIQIAVDEKEFWKRRFEAAKDSEKRRRLEAQERPKDSSCETGLILAEFIWSLSKDTAGLDSVIRKDKLFALLDLIAARLANFCSSLKTFNDVNTGETKLAISFMGCLSNLAASGQVRTWMASSGLATRVLKSVTDLVTAPGLARLAKRDQERLVTLAMTFLCNSALNGQIAEFIKAIKNLDMINIEQNQAVLVSKLKRRLSKIRFVAED